MKRILLLILALTVVSCHVTETIKISDNGSGTIATEQVREEEIYKKIAGESYGQDEKFQDTSYFFKDFINKYNATFFNAVVKERPIFLAYKDVEVAVNKNMKNKVFKTKLFQRFTSVEDIPDLYKTEDYAEDLKKSYSLGAEKHYFKLKYSFDGTVFRRIVDITSKENQEEKALEIDDIRAQFARTAISQNYILNYSFPRRIKYVSNDNAVLSSDKKSLTIEFILSDCITKPDITNLEVILEK